MKAHGLLPQHLMTRMLAAPIAVDTPHHAPRVGGVGTNSGNCCPNNQSNFTQKNIYIWASKKNNPMKLSEILWAEVNQEAQNTRKLLALVPFDNLDYKPHEKSMKLGKLAIHVAEILGWWKECLLMDELDFSKMDYKPKVYANNEELLAYFDDLLEKTKVILEQVDPAEFDKPWTMRNGEEIYFTLPKSAVVRTWCMNHLYHHRAQLGVYLRLLNIPLPSVYGPTADVMG